MKAMNDNIIPVQTAASVSTAAITTSQLFMMSAQLVATGAAAGTLKMQVSNDIQEVSGNPVNWSDLSGASVTVSGAGVYLIPSQINLCYRWLRLVYTNSGTGTISVNINAMGN